MSTLSASAVDDRVINPATAMDAVTLRVGDLENMSSYYADAFAMEPIAEQSQRRETHRVLGRGQTALVKLVHTPDLPPVDPRQAGLFHTAFLFDDPASLAATVYRAARDPRSRFVGSSDHAVSEAFYFTDPEGNGVELYTDRPRSAWRRVNGQIYMTTEYLDPNAYLQRHLDEDHLTGTSELAGRVGHVHLQVGELGLAAQFYSEVLGFETTLSSYPGALFTSAGGYHHHLAMNTWNSAKAGPRAASLGLGQVAVRVPQREDLDALAARLRSRQVAHRDDGRSVSVLDPWGTEVTVSLPGSTPEESL